MGELDTKPFMEAMRRKYCQEDLEDWAVEVIQLWEEYLKDPDWHPFKRIKLETAETVVVFLLFYITNPNRFCSQYSILNNLFLKCYPQKTCIYVLMQICLCMLDVVYELVFQIM